MGRCRCGPPAGCLGRHPRRDDRKRRYHVQNGRSERLDRHRGVRRPEGRGRDLSPLSRAVTGGVGKLIGTSVDTSDASIACRQKSVQSESPNPSRTERGSSARDDPSFSRRCRSSGSCDRKRNTLVYLVYSTKVTEGSPKNAISTVPMMPWRNGDDGRAEATCGDGEKE